MEVPDSQVPVWTGPWGLRSSLRALSPLIALSGLSEFVYVHPGWALGLSRDFIRQWVFAIQVTVKGFR